MPLPRPGPHGLGLCPASPSGVPVPHRPTPTVQLPHPHPAWLLPRAGSQGSVRIYGVRVSWRECSLPAGCGPHSHLSVADTCWAQGLASRGAQREKGLVQSHGRPGSRARPSAEAAPSSPGLPGHEPAAGARALLAHTRVWWDNSGSQGSAEATSRSVWPWVSLGRLACSPGPASHPIPYLWAQVRGTSWGLPAPLSPEPVRASLVHLSYPVSNTHFIDRAWTQRG